MSSGDHGAASRKPLRLLLHFSRGSLRIPDELADDIGARGALAVGPSAEVWPVEVGRDGEGAFLGRGWSEYAAACGVGAGWHLVLRYYCDRGVLTAKAFDSNGSPRELGTPIPHSVEATMSSKGGPRRPQFIGLLPPDSMEKMPIPPEFVQRYLPKENLDIAVVLGPLDKKLWRIKLEMNQSDVLFAGHWPEFLKFNDITKDNVLLLRYEANMVFAVKVFEPNGFQREYKQKDTRMQEIPDIEKQQEAPSASIQKGTSRSNRSSTEGQNKPNGSMASLTEASLRRKCTYEIGPPAWITKCINANALKKQLALPTSFCDAIGLRESCMITLKTSVNSTEDWKVHGVSCKKGSYLLVRGWLRFCWENSLKEGDACTFNVVETSLWHVVITRRKENINPSCNQETPSASRGKCKNSKRRKFSLNSMNKSPKMGCDYNIGPPAWVQKQMNNNTIKNRLCLPAAFCHAIGIRGTCTVTLKTSLSSTMSWEVCIQPYKKSSHHVEPGWKRFCQDNSLKVGDVCTINIVETTLWHVVIARRAALT